MRPTRAPPGPDEVAAGRTRAAPAQLWPQYSRSDPEGNTDQRELLVDAVRPTRALLGEHDVASRISALQQA